MRFSKMIRKGTSDQVAAGFFFATFGFCRLRLRHAPGARSTEVRRPAVKV